MVVLWRQVRVLGSRHALNVLTPVEHAVAIVAREVRFPWFRRHFTHLLAGYSWMQGINPWISQAFPSEVRDRVPKAA